MKNNKKTPKDENFECEDDLEVKPAVISNLSMAEPESRTIFIFGEINTMALAMFAGNFAALDAQKGPITVRITSNGGDVGSGLAIYDMIASAKNKVIVEGYGAVQSIAAVILQAGSVRRLSENVRFMIHSTSVQIPFPVNSKVLSTEGKEIDHLNDIVFHLLTQRAKFNKKELQDLCQHDIYFTAKDAKKHGFCDEIIYNNKFKKK
jgi:ATP-dependent Clp protease protease subunit